MGLPQGGGGYSATPFVHKINFKQSPNIFPLGWQSVRSFFALMRSPLFCILFGGLRFSAKEVFSAQRRYLWVGGGGKGNLLEAT